MFQVLEDGKVVGDFLMDAFLVRLKVTLQGEDVVAAVTVEQPQFTIMLLLAVISIVIKQHKTKTTAFPAIQVVENHENEQGKDTCSSEMEHLCDCRGGSSAALAFQTSFHSWENHR